MITKLTSQKKNKGGKQMKSKLQFKKQPRKIKMKNKKVEETTI